MEATYLLELFIFITALWQVRSRSVRVPTKITALEGSCVVVPCHTKPHVQVIWYKYHKIHYPVVYNELEPRTVEAQFRGRTSVVGKAAEGNCSLMIDHIKSADNNLQVYVWILPDFGIKRFHDKTVTISVVRASPTISVEGLLVEEGIFEANCSIKHSCPVSPPVLRLDGSTGLENSTSMDFHTESEGQWLHRALLRGKVTRQMHNSKVRCSARFERFTTQSQQITLNVLYKPASVRLIPEEKALMERDSVTIECAADSNPNPHFYTWFRRQMGRTSQINSTQRTMSFHNVTRHTSLSCMAHNDVGVGQSEWMDLDVKYAPLIQPESSCSLQRNVMRCLCVAVAFPNASISWIIDGNDTLQSSLFPVISINKNVARGEIRFLKNRPTNVSCTAWNQLGSDIRHVYSCSTLCQTDSSTSSLIIWVIFSIFLGGLLSGCGTFLFRKYLRKRTRIKDSDPSRQSAVRYSEEGRLSCVYDNYLEDMKRSEDLQQLENNSALYDSNGGTQSTPKDVHCIMDDYLLPD